MLISLLLQELLGDDHVCIIENLCTCHVVVSMYCIYKYMYAYLKNFPSFRSVVRLCSSVYRHDICTVAYYSWNRYHCAIVTHDTI